MNWSLRTWRYKVCYWWEKGKKISLWMKKSNSTSNNKEIQLSSYENVMSQNWSKLHCVIWAIDGNEKVAFYEIMR